MLRSLHAVDASARKIHDRISSLQCFRPRTDGVTIPLDVLPDAWFLRDMTGEQNGFEVVVVQIACEIEAEEARTASNDNSFATCILHRILSGRGCFFLNATS